MSVPRLPKKSGTIVTFRDSTPLRSPGNKKSRWHHGPETGAKEYYIHASVNRGPITYYRTSDTSWFSNIDRILKEIGTLFNVTIKYNGKLFPAEIISNPNLTLFDLESVGK